MTGTAFLTTYLLLMLIGFGGWMIVDLIQTVFRD